MKKIIFIILLLGICLYVYGQSESQIQYKLALKYAQPGLTPSGWLEMNEKNQERKYIYYADLNEDGAKEMIIPYLKPVKNKENKMQEYEYGLVLKIFNEKGRVIIDESNSSGPNTPIPYIHVKKISKFYQPIIAVLFFNPMWGGTNGVLVFKCMTVDKKISFSGTNIAMPWDLIFYPFDKDVPTFVEFSGRDKSSKKKTYTINRLDYNSKKLNIIEPEIIKFEKLLKEQYPQYYWSGKIAQ